VSGRFAGQVAVITGRAAGIGRAAAERMAAEGAQVSVWDVSDAALADCGFAAHAMRVDQSNEEQVIAAAADVVQKLGRLDIRVVSAGVTSDDRAAYSVHALGNPAWTLRHGRRECNDDLLPGDPRGQLLDCFGVRYVGRTGDLLI
jgi:3-oxoacyl-[acyl-carrier protein] reductase